MPHSLYTKALSACVSIALALFVAEVTLRLAHCPTLRPGKAAEDLYQRDPILGWKLKPGTYARYERQGQPALLQHIFSPGIRRSAVNQNGYQRAPIMLLGDSYLFGWSLSDEDTFAWKLSSALQRRVANFATPAYGTYQSLLQLRQRALIEPLSEIVIYGFNQFHEERNVALPQWTYALAISTAEKNASLPFCSMHNGKLVEHPVTQIFPNLWGRASSPLISLLEYGIAGAKAIPRMGQGRAVTKELIRALQKVTTQHHARFLVLSLDAQDAVLSEYEEYFRAHGIEMVDCRHPQRKEPAFLNFDRSHPNALVNSYWEKCAEQSILQALPATPLAESE